MLTRDQFALETVKETPVAAHCGATFHVRQQTFFYRLNNRMAALSIHLFR